MWRTCRSLIVIGGLALVAPVYAANANETFCSNPKRAGTLAVATLHVPWSQVEELSSWLQASSDKTLGMSFARVDAGYEGKPMTKKVIILQSPKVSVNIHITARANRNSASVEVMRTCITDDFEAWWPYWMRFKSAMKTKGYRLASR